MRNPLRPRTAGEPASANGASSFHLWWEVTATVPLTAAAVTLEVADPPAVDRLYFWALQVSFFERGRLTGGGHLGLQHHPAYPGSTAVNWGGYDAAGNVLSGAESPLPSTLGNANTRDYPWTPRRPYRLRISLVPGTTRWAGDVIDETTGETTRVRELDGAGGDLGSPVMWSEVFARCDHPPVAVRWSRPEVETVAGEVIPVTRLRIAFQARGDGGCDNTDSIVVDGTAVQRTNSPRRWRPGTVLELR